MPFVCHILVFGPSYLNSLAQPARAPRWNRSRAPSGPVKVLVTDRPHRRTTGLVDLTGGASALLAWFPASWASKIASKLLEHAPENAQKPQEINLTCPKRSCDELSAEGEKQLLQAVKFVSTNLAGFHLELDEDFQMAGSFQELIHGYTAGLVEPCMMRGLQPLGSNRLSLHANTNRYRFHARVPLMVTIMAIARGGLSWGVKGTANPQSSMAHRSLG